MLSVSTPIHKDIFFYYVQENLLRLEKPTCTCKKSPWPKLSTIKTQMKQHGKNISGNTWNQCHSLYIRTNWTSLIQFNEIGSICFIGFNEVSFVSFLPTTILCINLASATMLKLWDVFVWIFSFKEWVTFVARTIPNQVLPYFYYSNTSPCSRIKI